jgi:hypothetical protein
VLPYVSADTTTWRFVTLKSPTQQESWRFELFQRMCTFPAELQKLCASILPGSGSFHLALTLKGCGGWGGYNAVANATPAGPQTSARELSRFVHGDVALSWRSSFISDVKLNKKHKAGLTNNCERTCINCVHCDLVTKCCTPMTNGNRFHVTISVAYRCGASRGPPTRPIIYIRLDWQCT